MKLTDIRSLLDSGESAVEHLKRQRESLMAHRQQTDKMIEALDILLEDAMNENALSVDEIAQIVGDANFAAHQNEAEGRYGGTDDWEESRRRPALWGGVEGGVVAGRGCVVAVGLLPERAGLPRE